MASPAAIRAALATKLRNSFGEGMQVHEYLLANPTPPAIEIDLDTEEGVNYDLAMGRGLDEWWFIVRGFVASATDTAAQITRDEWLESSGPTSVKALLEADQTLNGAATACHVVSAKPRSFSGTAGTNTTYTAAEWRVRILATGN